MSRTSMVSRYWEPQIRTPYERYLESTSTYDRIMNRIVDPLRGTPWHQLRGTIDRLIVWHAPKWLKNKLGFIDADGIRFRRTKALQAALAKAFEKEGITDKSIFHGGYGDYGLMSVWPHSDAHPDQYVGGSVPRRKRS